MSNDYSRINFDPGQDYLGVLLQQGRPLTDADWNALVAQVNRRTHAGSYDTFGPAVVPETTPDGFLITPIAGGFTIGRGRIYVDGILAENHGAGALQWDAHLAEEFRPDPVAWNAQPYGHTPTIPAGFPYMVYVDVWQREIGPLEDPREDGNLGTPGRLVDVAIGVDTTARLQTVWQVRTLGGLAAGTDCGTPLDEIEAWATATAPSAGRLTTATGNVVGEPDPCLVPPLGGYKGAENQLYRVEVHTPGAPGTATFKWSRDNASIQARVLTLPSLTEIVVDSTGKDGVLRFNDGDWIEITNDARELNGEPGIVRRIAIGGGVLDSTRTITLETALAAGDFPVDADDVPTGAHTRIRKWNQAGSVVRADGTEYTNLDAGGSTGLITIPADATQLLLENGILVSFGVAAGVGLGEFHTGDYWVFAARTNDASVEILNAAPPRGIHHHYAKLAVVTAADDADDCREDWPPDTGCCTVVVRPGESIQGAIDSLPPQGGCVCLKSGVHEIDEPLVIANSNIILHGEAPGTRIVTTAPMQAMLFISGEAPLENVEVAHVTFDYASDPNEFDGTMILAIFNSARVCVHHCELLYTNANVEVSISGVSIVEASDIAFSENRLDRLVTGIYAEAVTALGIDDNGLRGLLQDSAGGPFIWSLHGINLATGADARVANNRFEEFLIAVRAAGERVDATGNDVRRTAFPAAMDNPATPGELIYAFDLRTVAPSRVHGNTVELAGQAYGGVYVRSRHAEVTANTFASSYATLSIVGPLGVYAGDFSADPTGAGDHVTIAANRFTGRQVAVFVRNSTGAHVRDNTIVGEERGVIGVALQQTDCAVVADNLLRDLTVAFVITGGVNNRLLDNTASELFLAAFVNGGRGLELDGDAFDDVSGMGIAVLQPDTALRIENTRIANCGYAAANVALALGVLQLDPFVLTDVTIENCEILDTGISPDGATLTGGLAWGIVTLLASHLKIADNRVAHSLTTQLDQNRNHRAALLWGMPAVTISLGEGQFTVDFGAALITNNVFQGPGFPTLVEASAFEVFNQGGLSIDLRFEKLTFSGNHCDHLAPSNDGVITADIFATRLVVVGNQVNTPGIGSSFGLGNADNVAVMSNHTTRNYTNVDTTIPVNFEDFNVITP